jgi:hypothetical protein
MGVAEDQEASSRRVQKRLSGAEGGGNGMILVPSYLNVGLTSISGAVERDSLKTNLLFLKPSRARNPDRVRSSSTLQYQIIMASSTGLRTTNHDTTESPA